MKLIIKQIAFLLLILCFISCSKSKEETEEKVFQWIGDTLELPEISEVLYEDSLYKKTVPINRNSKLKITTLLWGECKSCIEDLEKWESLFEMTQSKQNIEVYFFLYTPDFKLFKKSLYEPKLHKYPLIIDKNFKYIDNMESKLPSEDKVYQTLLLDSNNRIILVGNPTHGDKLMKLYKEEINKRLD